MLLTIILLSDYILHTLPQTLPQLPSRFTAIVEANIIQKNKTWIMEEWYDGPANKAKRIFYYGNEIHTRYEDFSNGKDQLWSYNTTHADTSNALSCTLKPYSTNTLPIRNHETPSGNLVSSANWFQFGANFSETYLGKGFVIRGINAEGWTRNVSSSFKRQTFGGASGPTINTTFALTYYFSLENWNYFQSSMSRIPLRVDVQGESVVYNATYMDSYQYRHYYDYVQFFADDLSLEEELKFDIPDFYEQCNVTLYCNVYDTADICSLTKGPPLPQLPNGFSALFEWTESDSILYPQSTFLMQVYYDYDNDRMHTVGRWAPPYKNAFHQLDILKDGEEGQRWSWIGDDSDVNEVKYCLMSGFSSNYTGWDYSIPVSNGNIINPHRFLQFDDNKFDSELSDEIWMGYTTIRGITAEKWKSNYNIVINGGEHSLWFQYPLPDNQRVIMNGSIYSYFSYNWTYIYAPNESVIPLATEYTGIYKLYNWSDTLNDYVEIERYDLSWFGQITQWIRGTPDESYFKPPTYWRKYCDIDEEYCMKAEHDDHVDEDVCDKGLDLPILPQHEYFLVLEGNDIVLETSHLIKMWYNYDNNEVRSEYYNNDNIIVTFDDFDEDRRWTWMHKINDSDSIVFCKVEPYKASVTGYQQFEEDVEIGHVKSASDLWRFGEKYNISYLGNDFNIRGINARSWHSTFNDTFLWNGSIETDVSYESIFYFADSDWDYYKSIETANIPLSITYKGSWKNDNNKSGTFNIEYHISSFFSGKSAFDPSEMEFIFADWYSQCDVNKYCEIYPENHICSDSKGPSMATIPDQWYALVEGTIKGNTEYAGTWVVEEWFDYINNQVHVVWHAGANWRGDAMHQLDRLDDDQKWVWYGDGDDDDDDGDEISSCQLTPSISNFSGWDLFVSETNGHVSKASTWFRWNDTKDATIPVWNGYTTYRSIPAQKWQSTWSEYDEIPTSPLQETFALQLEVDVTYYWSNTSWDMVVSAMDTAVPLGFVTKGTYTMYNKSKSSGKYDIFWKTTNFEAEYHFVVFNAGEQDEDYFQIPLQWKKCNISLYCDKYSNNEPCTGTVSRDSSGSKLDGSGNDGLAVGYIVLMIALFFIGLLIGVLVDRYFVRKRGEASFKSYQKPNEGLGPTDAGL